MEEQVRTIFQGSRTSQDAEDWVKQYDELLRAIDPKAPPAAVLFSFMFDSPDVPVDVTKDSEAILTSVMGENRTWAWAEVDLPMIRPGTIEQSIMGAIGIDFDNPREISILGLNEVHDRWKQTKGQTHPLIPILNCWRKTHDAAKE